MSRVAIQQNGILSCPSGSSPMISKTKQSMVVFGVFVFLLAGCNSQDGASAVSEHKKARGSAQQRARPDCAAAEVERMINRLAELSESDVGYSPTMTGNRFLPVDTEAEFGMGLLGQKPPVASDAMRQLVECGAGAVPGLMEHLDDDRETKIRLDHDSLIGGMFLADEYDYNRRTAAASPVGVNQGDSTLERDTLTEYVVTVGDLCFVALGQIINRHFNAVRYQPTAIIMVNSPVRSGALRAAVVSEWASLDAQRHMQSLIEDARRPDYSGRRDRAIKRLAYYYPEAAEQIVLELLKQPRYCVFRIAQFARERLYAMEDVDECRSLYASFVEKNGAAFNDGLLLQLQEDREWDRWHPRPEWKGDPREILKTLFPSVDASKPVYVDSVSQSDFARFIDSFAALQSQDVDQAVLGIFRSLGDDRFDPHSNEYLALACIRRLIGKGHDVELREYCRRHTRSEYNGKDFKELLELLRDGG
jgi:hypothetical protein